MIEGKKEREREKSLVNTTSTHQKWVVQIPQEAKESSNKCGRGGHKKTVRKLWNLEENAGEKLHNIGLGNNCLDLTAKAEAKKIQIDKLYYIKNFEQLYWDMPHSIQFIHLKLLVYSQSYATITTINFKTFCHLKMKPHMH